MFYTGIGSRKTPSNISIIMYRYAQETTLILRSGGADGADTAFESGARKTNKPMEIYLPWQGFNGRSSIFNTPTPAAMELAAEIHPNWNACSRGARNLHARSCHQILGMDLKTPSKFVICWTPEGKAIGGTRTAIILAQMFNIPVINLFNSTLKGL